MSSPDTGADLEWIRTGIPRWFEAVLAAIGILLCSPILGLVALGVRATSPGPVLFRQLRVGRGCTEFTLLKFRTMHVNQASLEVTARGDSRITPLGKWLRLLKLDEIPELWNVVRGDMSLVGPRPEVPRYVDVNDALWRLVLQVRPGITDPVTLQLRNEERLLAGVPGDTEEFYLKTLQPYKLAGYVEYLRHRSLLADVGVIVRTILTLVTTAAAPPPSIEEVRTTLEASGRRARRDE
jgi:lipopolysaccharide/colanic/teichoic acid biosynthesis glycosyltransferase